jgi:hypothetical protein
MHADRGRISKGRPDPCRGGDAGPSTVVRPDYRESGSRPDPVPAGVERRAAP